MKFIGNFLRILLIIICLSVAIYFSKDVFDFLKESYTNYQNQKRLEELYNRPNQPSDTEEETSDPSTNGKEEENSPKVDGMQNQYQELFAINPDIVGWLDIASGKLSTPVMQKDNEYYLTHDFYHNESKHGAVFMDERNQRKDSNLILYGHNLPSDKSMFNILTNYKKPEYYAQYPTFTFNTLFDNQEYVIFSVFLASTLPEHGESFDYINKLNFPSEAAKTDYLAELQKRSMLDTGVDVNASDQIVTLSTCSYEFTEARLAVVGRKLREGEKASDFGANVKEATNPLMPEIWQKTYGGK